MTMRKLILAAALSLCGATAAQADPILTPLLVSAGVTGTIAGTTITYASIAPYEVRAPK